MNDEELTRIIDNGEKLLNIEINSIFKEQIVKFASGLASICHQLCLNLCFLKSLYMTSRHRLEFSQKDFKAAIKKYIFENSDTLKAAFDKALYLENRIDYENTREILKAILKEPNDEVPIHKIIDHIKNLNPNYKFDVIKNYLERLSDTEFVEIIRKSTSGEAYSFSSPLFKAYAHSLFEDQMIITHLPFDRKDGESTNEFIGRVVQKVFGAVR